MEPQLLVLFLNKLFHADNTVFLITNIESVASLVLSQIGNSSQVSDGAGAVLLMKRSVATQKGLPVLGVFRWVIILDKAVTMEITKPKTADGFDVHLHRDASICRTYIDLSVSTDILWLSLS